MITATFDGDKLKGAIRRLQREFSKKRHAADMGGIAVPPEFVDELADMPKGGLPEDF